MVGITEVVWVHRSPEQENIFFLWSPLQTKKMFNFVGKVIHLEKNVACVHKRKIFFEVCAKNRVVKIRKGRYPGYFFATFFFCRKKSWSWVHNMKYEGGFMRVSIQLTCPHHVKISKQGIHKKIILGITLFFSRGKKKVSTIVKDFLVRSLQREKIGMILLVIAFLR